MLQLWEWVATDQFGRSRDYQARGPDVTEAAMRDHLAHHFHGLTITGLKRIPDGNYKPSTGEIESHAFHNGAYDAHLRSIGITPRTDILAKQARRPTRHLIERRPIMRPLIRR